MVKYVYRFFYGLVISLTLTFLINFFYSFLKGFNTSTIMVMGLVLIVIINSFCYFLGNEELKSKSALAINLDISRLLLFWVITFHLFKLEITDKNIITSIVLYIISIIFI